MSDFLFSLPTWLVVGLFAFCCVIAVMTCGLCMAAAMQNRRIERHEQRMVALNRCDVAERSLADEFHAWDADAELAEVLAFERRKPAEVIPLKGGGGWKR